jgi:hypothetical protein
LRLRRLLRLNLLVMLVDFMTNHATAHGAQHRMVPCDMPRDGAHRPAGEATRRLRALNTRRAKRQHYCDSQCLCPHDQYPSM